MLLLSSSYFCLIFSLIDILLHLFQLKFVIVEVFFLQFIFVGFFLSLRF